MTAVSPEPARTAAAWFLGLAAAAFFVLLWLRGAGRLLLPLLLALAAGALVVKFVRAVMRPVD